MWCILQDADQESIAAEDKDFRVNLYRMFDIATVFISQHEQKYTNFDGPNLNEDQIEEFKSKYDEIAETFLDDIFGYESTLSR